VVEHGTTFDKFLLTSMDTHSKNMLELLYLKY